MDRIGEILFGPDYRVMSIESLGYFIAAKSNTKIIYNTKNYSSELLPAGGYVLRHIFGSYLNPSSGYHMIGGKDGLQIRWRAHSSSNWTITEFPEATAGLDPDMVEREFAGLHFLRNLFWLEFTIPHYCELLPPSNMLGSVKIEANRYVARHQMHVNMVSTDGPDSAAMILRLSNDSL